MKYRNLEGQVFGRLTVKSYAGSIGSAQHATWKCECECGGYVVARGAYLRQGRIVSCGCRRKETQYPARPLPAGVTKTRGYRIWYGMKRRCEQPSKKDHLYMGKGIKICDRWQDPLAFLEDMGQPPKGTSIDRIDGSKGYSPENCRWATPKVQANNTSANTRIAFDGRIMTIAEWAELLGIKANTLTYRIRRGWSIADALTRNVQQARRMAWNTPALEPAPRH